jgi:putative ABC transport system permease protein
MKWVLHDASLALRAWRREPGFFGVVLATLAIGIGMNTAVFSVLYGALYQPLMYADESRLVNVGWTHPSLPGALLPLSPANYLDLREGLRTFTSLEYELGRPFVLTDRGEAGRHTGALASAGFFDVLGVRPAFGRTFTRDDDVEGAPAVVVLSDALWRSRFGGDPAMLNTQIRLNDEPHTIIGVMPPGFAFRGQQLWTPHRMTDTQRADRRNNALRVVGRLASGVTLAQAVAELSTRFEPLRREYALGDEQMGMSATTLRDQVKQRFGQPLLILIVAAAFVLLIACANVANLLLVRSERRQREVGVRAALGAGRARLAGQFLTESLLLSVAGGGAAILVAVVGVRTLVAGFGSAVPRASEIGIHAPVLGFALLASLATGLLVGVAPALRARPDFGLLRQGGRGGTGRITRMGRTLVVAEVALALMLVTGAGLLLKSYQRAIDSELGFDAHDLSAATLYFPPTRYAADEQVQTFLDRLLPQLEARPEIAAATLTSMVPIRESGFNTEISVVGREETKISFVEWRAVASDYFETMAIPLVAGRTFSEAEMRDPNANVAIINATLARLLFGAEPPLGWQLAMGQPREVIGVVGDIRDVGPDQQRRPMFYLPASRADNLVLRGSREGGAAVDALRSAVRDIDPEVAVIRFDRMSTLLDSALSGRRFQLSLIGVFALTALLLSCIGIYGVLSYSVERQTKEIGVRMALGAPAAGVTRLVAWRGTRLTLIGVAIGAAGAFVLRSGFQAQLFEVESFDPAVYVAVAVLQIAVAVLASIIPAHRASRVQPTEALRAE